MKKLVTALAGFAIIGFGAVHSVDAEDNSVDVGYSIVDYLDAEGQNSDFSNRESIAESKGIDNYEGTSNQNLLLLDKLRGTSLSKNNSKVDNNKSGKEEKESSNKVEGKTISMNATAYTAHCAGCSGVTRTGVDLLAHPDKKVVAVDPNVIPLGSKVYVEGYGYAHAEDTGGDINGNRIDLFIPNQQNAMDYGRQNIQVTIID